MPGPFSQTVGSDPFPPMYRCRLEYSEVVNLASGVGGLMGTEAIFALNDLYDPNYSGTGHQPYGFDTLASLYRRYRVDTVSFTLQFSNPNEDSVACAAMVQASAGTYALTGHDIATVDETPNITMKLLNNTGSQSWVVNSGPLNLHQVEGVPFSVWQAGTTTYGAAVTTDPTLLPFLRIAIGSAVGSASASIQVLVRFKFNAVFYERKVLAQS